MMIYPNVRFKLTCVNPECSFLKDVGRAFTFVQIWEPPAHSCHICGSKDVIVINTTNENEWASIYESAEEIQNQVG